MSRPRLRVGSRSSTVSDWRSDGLPVSRSDQGGVAALLRPTSIAVIGASDRSRWSSLAFQNLQSFSGPLHLVNRRGGTVHGRPAAESCTALSEPVDLGIILVPVAAVGEALSDLAAAGGRSAVILTSGYAEVGADGAELQRRLVATARQAGIRLLGPNCLGFVNFADDVRVWTTPVEIPSRRHGVAILSQSGATALFLSDLARRQDVGLSHIVSTGNEADLDVAAFLDHLVQDESTRAVALFVETVRHPDRFIAASLKALEGGKPIVVLKVGASEVTAKAAAAHTGALVGDDRVFDGLCRQYGLIRTRSIEELLSTADILARTGRLRPGGLAVMSNSGGICEIAADTAHARGVALPEIEPAVANGIRALMPGYGTPHNPLDLTGGVEPEHCGDILRQLTAQPDYAAVLCPFYPIPNEAREMSPRLDALHAHLSKALNDIEIPGLLASYTPTSVNDHAREIAARIEAPYVACGLDRAISGLAAAMWWSDRLRDPPQRAAPGAPGEAERPRSEHDALRYLAGYGVPVVPNALARDREEARRAARLFDGPVVLKIASADIAHKSDIGGVALNLSGDDAVASAYDRVVAAARSALPHARLDGVLVTPMRERGLELLVGCSRDPQWGLILAVGLGGIWVEVLQDASLRILPVGENEIRRMLTELRGAKLLEGQRGVPAADPDPIARAVAAIGRAALAAGPDLDALDVNPLWVRGDRVEALDALFVWGEPAHSRMPLPERALGSEVSRVA